jgi:hypothetical protein
MCWFSVTVALFTFAVLCKGGLAGHRLQVVDRGRRSPLYFDDLMIRFHSSARDSCLLIKRIEVSLALLHAGNDVRLQVRLLGDIHQNLNSQSQSQSI